MDLFSSLQVWGIFLFIAGAGLLSWCSRWERVQDEWRKNPRNKYRKSRRKTDFILPTTLRGTLMTVSGSMMSFAGITMFFLPIF